MALAIEINDWTQVDLSNKFSTTLRRTLPEGRHISAVFNVSPRGGWRVTATVYRKGKYDYRANNLLSFAAASEFRTATMRAALELIDSKLVGLAHELQLEQIEGARPEKCCYYCGSVPAYNEDGWAPALSRWRWHDVKGWVCPACRLD